MTDSHNTFPGSPEEEPNALIDVEKAKKILEDRILWYEYADPIEISAMDTMFYEIDKKTIEDPKLLEEFVIGMNKITFDSVLKQAGETGLTFGKPEPLSPENPGLIED